VSSPSSLVFSHLTNTRKIEMFTSLVFTAKS